MNAIPSSNRLRLSLAPVSMARTIREEKLTLESYLQWCAESGFDAVDFACPTKYPWFWQDFGRQMEKAPRIASSAGLEIGGFCCGNNFARTSQDDFRREVDMVLKAIDYAAALGCASIRLFGGTLEGAKTGGDAGMNFERGFQRIIEGLEYCVPHAEKKGIVLALENHGGLPAHSWELAALLRHFDSSSLRCAFDCANFIANNLNELESPLRAYDALRDFIAYVHVKDFGPPVKDLSRRVEPCLMGDGNVPLRQLMAKIVTDGYRGLFAIEYEASQIVPEREGIRKNLTYFREIEASLRVLRVFSK